MIGFAILEIEFINSDVSPIANRIKMLGNFQQSQLRIEIEASTDAIRDSLLHPRATRKMALRATLCTRNARRTASRIPLYDLDWATPRFIIKWTLSNPTVSVWYSVELLTGSTNGIGEKVGYNPAWKEFQFYP